MVEVLGGERPLAGKMLHATSVVVTAPLEPETSTSPIFWDTVIEPNAFSSLCRPRPLLKSSWPFALTRVAEALRPTTATSPNLFRAESGMVSGIVMS